MAKFWANIKRWIKDRITEFTHLYNALQHFFILPNTR
ncbi:hypothetical protein [Candidatus Sarmatiella mevalonica]